MTNIFYIDLFYSQFIDIIFFSWQILSSKLSSLWKLLTNDLVGTIYLSLQAPFSYARAASGRRSICSFKGRWARDIFPTVDLPKSVGNLRLEFTQFLSSLTSEVLLPVYAARTKHQSTSSLTVILWMTCDKISRWNYPWGACYGT